MPGDFKPVLIREYVGKKGEEVFSKDYLIDQDECSPEPPFMRVKKEDIMGDYDLTVDKDKIYQDECSPDNSQREAIAELNKLNIDTWFIDEEGNIQLPTVESLDMVADKLNEVIRKLNSLKEGANG